MLIGRMEVAKGTAHTVAIHEQERNGSDNQGWCSGRNSAEKTKGEWKS